MRDILVIIVTAVLSDNLVLSRSLGVCPFLGSGSDIRRSLRLGLLTTLCMCVSAMIAWPVSSIYLRPNGLSHLETLAFVLIIASVVQLAETLIRHFSAENGGLGTWLPLIASNCAIIGVCTQNAEEGYSFAQSVANAAAGGAGFIIALLIFAGIHERIDGSDIPKSFRGIAISLIAAAIVSLSFMGFAGLAGGIFGS